MLVLACWETMIPMCGITGFMAPPAANAGFGRCPPGWRIVLQRLMTSSLLRHPNSLHGINPLHVHNVVIGSVSETDASMTHGAELAAILVDVLFRCLKLGLSLAVSDFLVGNCCCCCCCCCCFLLSQTESSSVSFGWVFWPDNCHP
jgi:hypothetical protein